MPSKACKVGKLQNKRAPCKHWPKSAMFKTCCALVGPTMKVAEPVWCGKGRPVSCTMWCASSLNTTTPKRSAPSSNLAWWWGRNPE